MQLQMTPFQDGAARIWDLFLFFLFHCFTVGGTQDLSLCQMLRQSPSLTTGYTRSVLHKIGSAACKPRNAKQ